jgi:S-formylglutathione hydrolase FrmB
MEKYKRKFALQFLWLFLVFAFSFPAFGQDKDQKPVKRNEVVTHKLNSKLMAREMSYNVIFPFGYENKSEAKTRFPVIFLLHGLMGHFDNWAVKTELALYARDYDYIFVMPEGGDGWYTDSASENNDRYESYIIQELIPEVDKKFRTLADKKHRAVAGLSMGGYGSIKFGLKHPHLFSLVGSFSGALGVTAFTEKEVQGAFLQSILNIFGEVGSQTRKENDVFQIVREVQQERIKDLPFIYLDCGTEDFLFQNNTDFAKLLREKKIPHEYRELPGKHDWNFWGAQVREFLELSEKYVNN